MLTADVARIKNTLYARFGVEPEVSVDGIVIARLRAVILLMEFLPDAEAYEAWVYADGALVCHSIGPNPLTALVAAIRLARIAGISIPNRDFGVSHENV